MGDTCFYLNSNMAFNNLVQSFPNNPDSHAQGYATFKLCTNGTLIADTALVYGGQSPLIASHIHRAQNGDGENGSGPPVISFCGNVLLQFPFDCKLGVLVGAESEQSPTSGNVPWRHDPFRHEPLIGRSVFLCLDSSIICQAGSSAGAWCTGGLVQICTDARLFVA